MTQRLRGRALQTSNARIKRRDNGLCQACARQGRVTLGHEVDHIIGLAQGGPDDDGNKELLCHDCHSTKTAKDNGKRPKPRIGVDGFPISPGHPWSIGG
jgi:5-methylcytosine-specific restriction protein A